MKTLRTLHNLFARRPSAAPTVRPQFDILEDRTVPSTIVADFPGYGLYRFDTTTQNWQLLNGHDPAAMAVDPCTGDVVASFHGYGTALWTSATGGWTMLTGAEASLLAISGCDQNIFGEFNGSGVWAFHPNTGWIHLTCANATSMAADSSGNLACEFPGNGVWYFTAQQGTWTQLTAADASTVVMSSPGCVVGEFPGNGVWMCYNYSWCQLTGVDAQALCGDGTDGTFGASFDDYGTYSCDTSGDSWTQLSTDTADDIATDGSDYSASYQDSGTCQYDDTSGQWTQIDGDTSDICNY